MVIGIAAGLAAGKSIGPRYKLETIKVGWKMNGQNMTIKSPAFVNMGNFPVSSTARQGINPELLFENIPANAKSLVLIMDDPDAPYGTFDHWILFNISPKIKDIKEGSIPAGALKGKNTAGTLAVFKPLSASRKSAPLCFQSLRAGFPAFVKRRS